MDKEVLKAINNISKRLNEVEYKLDRYFSEKHKINSDAIVDTDTAVMELADLISQMTEEGQNNGENLS